MNTHITTLRCTLCGHEDDPRTHDHACTKCGGIHEALFDYDAVRPLLTRDTLKADPRRDVRRYLPLLPVDANGPMTPLPVGGTPLTELPAVAQDLGVRRFWAKDDGRNPTGSFKDRASFVGVARAKAKGCAVIAAASTGNAATSVAGLAASMGLTSHIFVPASAPEAKVAQLLIYGAKVFLVDADYDATFDLCQKAVAHFGWYDRSAAVNPYLVEGKKTCGLELGEELAHDLPDWVAMSVGDGCSLAGTHKGLVELHTLGLIGRVPRMLAVQAEGAAPLTTAFQANTEQVLRIEAATCADSINVGMPRNPVKALRAVRASHGAFVNVSDQAILDWIPRLAQKSGVFAEPAAVTAVAGIEAAQHKGIIKPSETAVAVISGTGLKDIKNAMRTVSRPEPLAPSLEAVQQRVRNLD